MTATAAQLDRTAKDWSCMAGENVRVEQTGGTLYGFCSELGALRVAYEYRRCENFRAEYSTNLSTWFVSIELPAHSIAA